MRILPYVFNNNSQKTNFKKWVDVEYTEKVEYDRYPDNPDYHFIDTEYETYTKTEWFPEYDDYFSEDTVKEDAQKYRNEPNQKDFLKAAARARIIQGNKEAHTKEPKFYYFGTYRSLVNKYVKNVQEFLKQNKDN